MCSSDLFFLALAAAGGVGVFLLTRRIPRGRCDRLARRLPGTLAGVWLLGTPLALANLAEPRVNSVLFWLCYSATSFWYPWLAWSGFRPDVRPRRRPALAMLFVVQMLFLLLFRIEGASGQDRFIVQWRLHRSANPVYELSSGKIGRAHV